MVINNTEGEDVHLKSAEGATQEDVVAMPMNGISIQPLIDTLGEQTNPKQSRQAWYADDGSATGTLKELLKWWNLLCKVGPKFGYFPNSGKTVLITKNEQLLLKANEPQKETCTLKLLLGQHHSRRNLGKSVT